jgi:hypothetical protein
MSWAGEICRIRVRAGRPSRRNARRCSVQTTSRYGFWIFALLTVLLGIALAVRSLGVQRTHDPICRGNAGAGFPLTFLCDTLGESPTESWGRIDEADRWSPNPFFLLNVLFYMAFLWIPWFIVRGNARWSRPRKSPSQ